MVDLPGLALGIVAILAGGGMILFRASAAEANGGYVRALGREPGARYTRAISWLFAAIGSIILLVGVFAVIASLVGLG